MDAIAVVEIPANSSYKYEIHNGTLKLDRVSPCIIPANYGYIPNTAAPDGDALDVFILAPFEPLLPQAEVNIRIIGAFKCVDNGVVDDKLLAEVVSNYQISDYTTLIQNYLETYKSGFKVESYVGREEALAILQQSKEVETNG